MTTDSPSHGTVAAAMIAAGDVAYDWDLIQDSISWAGPVDTFAGANDENVLATGEGFHSLINPDDLTGRLKALSDHYLNHGDFDCEYRVRRSDGNYAWVHDRGRAEFGEKGEPVRLRGVLRMITRRKQVEAKLEQLANYDELTGHFNRTRLRQALHQTMAHSQRYGVQGAYLSVGIDKLSMINAGYGYQTADAVIVGVAERLERLKRSSDLMGRIGGDVFGVILCHCPEANLPKVAEKVLRAFRKHPIHTPSGAIHVSVSIGGVAFPSFVQTPFEAMTRAEAAMQEAKHSGRDCFRSYRMTDEQRSGYRRAIAIGEQVQDAIRDDRLLFAFQPIVSQGGRRVEFYECLMRLLTPEGKLVSAGEFMPVVEWLGLARSLDRRVLELAVRELTEFDHITLAINISGVTTSDHGWLRALMALLRGRPDVAQRLIIEITETAAIQDIEETARFVTAVRKLGCRVALDDFGSGYTTFRHFKSLAVDIVKIDGSYIENIDRNLDNQSVVRALAMLASTFGLNLVAERIETAAEAATLARLDIECLQGYYFARPSTERPWLADIDGTLGAAASGIRVLAATGEPEPPALLPFPDQSFRNKGAAF